MGKIYNNFSELDRERYGTSRLKKYIAREQHKTQLKNKTLPWWEKLEFNSNIASCYSLRGDWERLAQLHIAGGTIFTRRSGIASSILRSTLVSTYQLGTTMTFRAHNMYTIDYDIPEIIPAIRVLGNYSSMNTPKYSGVESFMCIRKMVGGKIKLGTRIFELQDKDCIDRLTHDRYNVVVRVDVPYSNLLPKDKDIPELYFARNSIFNITTKEKLIEYGIKYNSSIQIACAFPTSIAKAVHDNIRNSQNEWINKSLLNSILNNKNTNDDNDIIADIEFLKVCQEIREHMIYSYDNMLMIHVLYGNNPLLKIATPEGEFKPSNNNIFSRFLLSESKI